MVIERAPLEDELGDVLDKAARCAGLTEQAVAERARLDPAKLRDVLDYRGSLDDSEVAAVAGVLGLNVAGLRPLASGRYPLPEIRGLPFCLYPLRMPHGIGVANAYIVADCASSRGLLFDAGPDPELLRRVWPAKIVGLDAIFISHQETEHAGGLNEVRRRFPGVPVFGPVGTAEGVVALQDGSVLTFGSFEVRVWQTPGHSERHHCYLLRTQTTPGRPPLLISGDLLFAGSIGGAYFCANRLAASLRRVMAELPPDTVVAPGHGPLTTIKNERAFNPFVV